MLQSRLHNKICSLHQHTLSSKRCHSPSLHLKLLRQITMGGGTRHIKVLMIKVWQHLASWSNKSNNGLFFSCFIKAKKSCHLHSHLSSCFPKSFLALMWCSSNLALLKRSAFICLGRQAQHACSFEASPCFTVMQLHTLTLLPGTRTIYQLVAMEYLYFCSWKVKCLAQWLLSGNTTVRKFIPVGSEILATDLLKTH